MAVSNIWSLDCALIAGLLRVAGGPFKVPDEPRQNQSRHLMLLNRVILMKMGNREEQKEEVGRDTKGALASRAFPMVSDVFPGGNGEVCQTKHVSSPCSVSGEAQQGCRTGAALLKVAFGQIRAKWTLLQKLPLLWQHTVAVNELKKLFPHTQKSLSTPPKCSKGASALSE